MTSPKESLVLRIHHVTGFRYEGLAGSSYNEVRMTPPTLSRQRVVSTSLVVSPHAVQSTYRDYFGTIVTTFDLHEPHRQLEVVADATVETLGEPISAVDVGVEALADGALRDQFAEYLVPTARTTLSTDVLRSADLVDVCSGDVRSFVDHVVAVVRGRVAYVKGSTHVSSTAEESWQQREGVCQDLTHVTIALLRQVGVPARYVSGYLHAREGAAIGETVAGESHAWVEYYCGQWVGVDPTSGDDVGRHHVVVAKGREYGDVPPLKGIYHGDPSSALGVVVEVTRVA